MEVEGRESSVVPEAVMEAVKRTLASVEQVRARSHELAALSDPEALAQMPPLQRAESLLLVAKATTTLFALRLRCNGVNPDEHPIKSEFERLSLYQDKLERLIDSSKGDRDLFIEAPTRPSTTLNYQAATRFIEHSLPDLTPEQRQKMRNISRAERKKTNVQKKRKLQSTEKKSVQTAAKEFLEKAAQELLGDNKGSFKGPLWIDTSEEEEEE